MDVNRVVEAVVAKLNRVHKDRMEAMNVWWQNRLKEMKTEFVKGVKK